MNDYAVSFYIPGEPVAFARAGSNGKRRFTPSKQASYREAVQWAAKEPCRKAGLPFVGPIRAVMCFEFEYPKNYSAKRKAATTWKNTKPDLDNLVKEISDSLNKIAYHDDAQIVELFARKRFGSSSGVTITIEDLT